MDDITKWHDVIKAPDLSGIDWEQLGDINMDGTVDSHDAILALNEYVLSVTGGSDGVFADGEGTEVKVTGNVLSTGDDGNGEFRFRLPA